MESDAVVRMAREDSRWFAVAIIVLALVLFLALPLAALIAVDHIKTKALMQAEVRNEVKKMRELRQRLEEEASKEK